MKMTLWNELALLEENFEDFLVLANRTVFQFGPIGPLQAPPWPGFSHCMQGGIINGMGVAVDMDKLGSGEQLQQHLNAASMAGRFKQQRTSVFERQLLDE